MSTSQQKQSQDQTVEKIENHISFPLLVHKQPIAGAADVTLAETLHITF
jgi:hypothetical protein